MAQTNSAADARLTGFARARRRLHAVLVATHRYVGLTIAVVLVVASVTGSIVVFKNELDAVLNLSLSYIEAAGPDATPMDRLKLREVVEQQLPTGLTVWELPLTPPAPGRSIGVNLNWDGTPLDRPVDTAYVDPSTGKVLGLRNQADVRQSWRNLIPFIYEIHYSLALGEFGSWLLGATAVLWTIDCFVALYLTFPRPLPATATKAARRSWLARWKPSWLMRAGSLFTAIFTFHRASGLWVWPLLLLFAWSSVALRMGPVYHSVTSLFFANYEYAELPGLVSPRRNPKLTWSEALAKGKEYMEREANRRGFTIVQPYVLSHEPDFGFFRYQVQSSLDPTDRWCDTTVWIDSDTGEFVEFWAPTGLDAGHTFTTWLSYLHFGWVGGLGYRLLIFVVGLVAAVLCVTGVLIWWRKLGARIRRRGDADGLARRIAWAFGDLLIVGAIGVATFWAL